MLGDFLNKTSNM